MKERFHLAQIAILLSTFNGEKYLSEQLDSLLNQSYEDWICYIHDDGSTDSTIELLNKYNHRFPEKFNILNYESTGSACNNFISLLKYPKEQYVMFCDQDDVWLPEKIEVTLNLMEKLERKTHGSIAVFTDLNVVDSKLEIIAPSYFEYENRNPNNLDIRSLLKKNVAAGCTIMINTVLRDFANKNQNLLSLAMHDWGIMLLAQIDGKIGFIDKPTILYRQHQSNQVGANRLNYIERIKFILFGNKLNAIRENIHLERRFAQELKHNNISDDNTRNLIEGLSEIEKKNKLTRMKFYLDNELISYRISQLVRLFVV